MEFFIAKEVDAIEEEEALLDNLRGHSPTMNVTMLASDGTAERVHMTTECMHLQVPLGCIIQISVLTIHHVSGSSSSLHTDSCFTRQTDLLSPEWSHCTRGGWTWTTRLLSVVTDCIHTVHLLRCTWSVTTYDRSCEWSEDTWLCRCTATST